MNAELWSQVEPGERGMINVQQELSSLEVGYEVANSQGNSQQLSTSNIVVCLWSGEWAAEVGSHLFTVLILLAQHCNKPPVTCIGVEVERLRRVWDYSMGASVSVALRRSKAAVQFSLHKNKNAFTVQPAGYGGKFSDKVPVI